ncbi:MAG: hypothetical protein ACM3PY_06455 [Omnitrophica WOR_2 bacterium]
MAAKRDPKYWLNKKTRRKTGYPIGTVAFYGPTDQFASKVVAGIQVNEKDEEVSFLEKWFAHGTDVRMDAAILEQIADFFDQHQVARIAMVDRIIGCPHEEGIDYPEGEVCPQCPFWAHRDRWTGEIID